MWIHLQRGQRCFTKRGMREEYYMAHIALAERGNHISDKFHNANSTTVTVFPK
ncbi:hypothetical protein AMTRI_Chr05g72780 [Amborella trichopoda]